MSNLKATFNALATTDVWTGTLGGTIATGDVFNIIAQGKTLAVTVGSLTTIAQVCQTIAEAFNGTTLTDTTASVSPGSARTVLPVHAELRATYTSTTVILTAITPGRSTATFTVSKTSASGTWTIAHTVTATGPEFWDNTANWDGGVVPATGDNVTIDRPGRFTDGLGQSTVTLASLTITNRFDGTSAIGRPVRNPNGYEEFRKTNLEISATTVTINSGSGLIKIDFGSAQTTAAVYATGTTAEAYRRACQLTGTHTSNALKCLSQVIGGAASLLDVGWGSNGETSALSSLLQEGGTVELGANVGSLATLTQVGVNCITYLNCSVTTVRYTGTLYLYAGTVTTLNGDSGIVYDFTATTLGTLTLNNAAVYNADGNISPKTITNSTLNDNSSIVDTADRITFTNPHAWKGVLRVSAA